MNSIFDQPSIDLKTLTNTFVPATLYNRDYASFNAVSPVPAAPAPVRTGRQPVVRMIRLISLLVLSLWPVLAHSDDLQDPLNRAHSVQGSIKKADPLPPHTFVYELVLRLDHERVRTGTAYRAEAACLEAAKEENVRANSVVHFACEPIIVLK